MTSKMRSKIKNLSCQHSLNCRQESQNNASPHLSWKVACKQRNVNSDAYLVLSGHSDRKAPEVATAGTGETVLHLEKENKLQKRHTGQIRMNRMQKFGMVFVMCLVASAALADSLELKNGSLIKGKFMGGNQDSINYQVGSSMQTYDVGDVRALRFDSGPGGAGVPVPSDGQSYASVSAREAAKPSSYVTIPAGTRISVRTIDDIDSTKNHVGDRFQASLDEPLIVDDKVVAAKGADVYGRLEESKETGTFTGRSQLKVALTGIVVDGKTVPLVTGDYELTGKSKGASTAKRTVGGAALGTIIGAIAGGGKGAAIGAGTGAGVGAGSEIITKGDQVKIPSETLLDFTLEQGVSIPR